MGVSAYNYILKLLETIKTVMNPRIKLNSPIITMKIYEIGRLTKLI